jgi:hypothetical protein
MNVIKKGIVIKFAANLGRESNEFLTGKNLNRNSRPLVGNTKVVGTPQMVFTNPIMTKTLKTHVLIKNIFDILW